MAKKVKFDFKLSDFIDGVTFKSEEDKQRAKKEVSKMVLDEVLESVAKGESPVKGERVSFKSLKPSYADKEKGGDSTPNLYLEGDMLNSLTVEDKGSFLRLTVGNDQQGKADNHNKFSPKSKATGVPKRRFIPLEGGFFRENIKKMGAEIIKKYKK